jgi:hypothetical protein
MIDDTLQSLRDLLGVFPIVRRIEAERLALDLDRHAESIPVIQTEMDAIKSAVEISDNVTADAVHALRQNDAAIEDALDGVVQRSLIADKLLVFRNFAGAVLGGIAIPGRGIAGRVAVGLAKAGTELSELGGKSWSAIKDEFPKGVGAAARVAPMVGLITLAGWIAGPVTGIASVVPAFKPIADTLKKVVTRDLKEALAGDAEDNPKSKARGKSR